MVGFSGREDRLHQVHLQTGQRRIGDIESPRQQFHWPAACGLPIPHTAEDRAGVSNDDDGDIAFTRASTAAAKSLRRKINQVASLGIIDGDFSAQGFFQPAQDIDAIMIIFAPGVITKLHLVGSWAR